MVFKSGQSGNPAGRQKGSVNRINIDVRQKFYKVFDDIGKEEKLSGDEAFRVWARSNKKTFYSLFCKLAPTNLNINDNRQHESFMDRMAKELLLKEVQVIEAKQVTADQDNNQDNMSSLLSMGNEAIITPSNGGHMGDDTIDKESNHPIISEDSGEVVSSDKVGSWELNSTT